MSSIPLDGIIVGLASVGISAIAFVYATRAQIAGRKTEEIKAKAEAAARRDTIDVEAFDRARTIYESSLASLERQNAQLHGELDRVTDENERLRARVAELENRIIGIERRNRDLETRISELERRNGGEGPLADDA